jgi:peptidyl-prolyl cis-trans isomerase C
MNASMTAGKRWRAASVAASLAVVVACSQKPASDRPPEPGDKAVARVDGAPVWTSDVKREAATQGLIGQGEPLDTGSSLFRQVLDEVVDQKLLAAEAMRRRLDKDPANQRRLAADRERVLGDLLLESSVGKHVDEATINSLYREMVDNETPTEAIHLRQIVSATEADAAQVRELLTRGASFDALAAERSRDEATRFKGGELPPGAVDMLPAPYAQALAQVKTGQIVGPFKTDAGWVVVRVDDRRREAPIPLDVARPQIIRYLTLNQVKDLILTLRQKAKVETLLGPTPPDTPMEPASAPPAATAPPVAQDVKK